ncbi:ATP-binding cassette domain-containing protein [Persicitalea jodogahamensis]|uniref:Molybdenum ABC transporter ATP-binding protein n=1 Tax=Persicitalea jodogahamensis TaxID=402147 RepID=A0A8J3DCD1_9BACT|nr:ATP-binding cassette domain-containing protein [Persicitalea jodogahamensis]GHB88524.1 molybdenum ABC transporter ATP-binding protein [Persicitalea jodogahamensis]
MSMISLENVSVRKFDTPVLFDLDWRVNPGEQWAIVGGNGSGKTSLLETIAGRWATARGILRKQGAVEFVANDYSFHRIARAAAQYHQQRFQAHEAGIAPTVREVLTEQMKPVGTVDDQSVQISESHITVKTLQNIAEMLQLTALLDQPFITLSNGETRRMLLARSLVKRPDILLLDHPFVGLDVFSRQILHDALAELIQQGTTVLLATSPSEIPDWITNVLTLEKGKIKVKAHYEKDAYEGSSIVPLTGELPVFLDTPVAIDFDYAFDLRNIRVVYDGRAVLDNIDWKVRKGEKWALTGPNGSGKSTLLSILTADHPQRFANDYDLFDQKRGGKGSSIWDIKQKIGHVSPELHLYFPVETTVFKAIASGFFDATGIYFKKLDDIQTERVGLLARLLGVAHAMQRPLQKLSKGEQRLVLLARALVKNPPLLILDEPCQGLDIGAVEHFKSVVDAVCRSGERTLVYVSHYPHEIPGCINRFINLEKGKVAEIR